MQTLLKSFCIVTILFAEFCGTRSFAGPYAPGVTDPGTTAYNATSQAFLGWATGYTNYIIGINENDEYDLDPDYQHPEMGIGAPDCNVEWPYPVVCLGGGGKITMTFDLPIADGSGPDFAVFENAMDTTYLELAFVEVSSDGTHFFRFPSRSLTDHTVPQYPQTPEEGVDPTDLHNLASKYIAGYGTPFDLQDIPENPLLDKNNIRFIKLVDIIGDGRHRDSNGSAIYDPYPTTGTPGFDLDAIGVINTCNPLEFNIINGHVILEFTALENRFYRIETTEKLSSHTRWTPLLSTFEGDGTACVITNIPSSSKMMFYNIIEWYEK